MFPTDVTGSVNSAISKFSSQGRLPGNLPNPFYDNATMLLPTSIKELFKLTAVVYNTNSLVNSVVKALASYPITELMIQPADRQAYSDEVVREGVKAWKHLFDQDLNLRPLLIEMGIDMQVYGSSFVVVNFLKEKVFVCKACGSTLDTMAKKIKPMLNDGSVMFNSECDHCNASEEFIVAKEIELKNRPPILKRINPDNIQIEYNGITGEYVYFYRLPNKEKQRIISGDPEFIASAPAEYIKAAISGNPIRIKPGRIYHLKSPGLAEADFGWPKPPVLAVLKDIIQYQVIRRGQESIFQEHITATRVMFPQSSDGTSAANSINLGEWKRQIQEFVYLSKQDPNIVAFSSIPVGVANLGGDARALLLSSELEFQKMLIINGLGCPREIIEGGTSYSSSSIAIRVFGNKMLGQVKMMEHFVLWAKDQIRDKMGMIDIKISFKRLKMVDDVQKMQLAQALNQGQKISSDTLLSDADYDSEVEDEKMELEAVRASERNKKLQILAAKAQAEAQIEIAKGQVSAMFEQQKLQESLSLEQSRIAEEAAEQKWLEYLESLPVESILQLVQEGKLSHSDLISVFIKKPVQPEMIGQLYEMIKQMINQVLATFGIDPITLDGLPLEMARKISNGLFSPSKLQMEIQRLVAQSQQGQQPQQAQGQEQGQEQAQQGQQGQAQPAQPSPQERAAGYEKQIKAAKSHQEKTMIENKLKASDPEAFKLIGASGQDQRPEPEKLPARRAGR